MTTMRKDLRTRTIAEQVILLRGYAQSYPDGSKIKAAYLAEANHLATYPPEMLMRDRLTT